MTEKTYDVPISEVARILDKSDRQVRRYVKERRLKARPIRVDGHIKLMFNRDEVSEFGKRFSVENVFAGQGREIVVDSQLMEDEVETGATDSPAAGVVVEPSDGVKYAIDALREQIRELKDETRELHVQLEQRSGQVGFLQGKIEMLQEEIKALAPATPPVEEIPDAHVPWWRNGFFRKR